MFCLIMKKFLIYAMNVSSTTVLIRKLKPFDATFLSADNHWFSWLKYQFLKFFEDWLTRIAVKPGIYAFLLTTLLLVTRG